ncbi:hypothetical protein [Micromonospora inaquosa]|uniref:Uncharacterized protein n=1 Tax=Micromonospora inaquosa TaxID=2203716 RepID=A0A3N9X7Z6_9ACTN|nr:hypothetical protein [Micromonospora inaquosa]RQX09082.1 hypothetical protein DLJ59_01240 [Micromonospora inaquosa]
MGKVVRGGQRSARATPLGKVQPTEDVAASGRALDRDRSTKDAADARGRAAHTKTVEGTQHTTT